MKKQWQKPEIDILDVNKTMLQGDGNFTDNDFPDQTPKDQLTFS
ncbi:paeninodin family lasso peptide [Salipaludibacillus neizhouensis]|nr:paeninodin family lasso peptide [Salipaludibacillus neizhouensis]